MPKIRIGDKFKAENKAPITEDCYIPGKLLDCTVCKTLLYMGGSKSFVSKTFYLKCSSLISLPRFV